MWVSRAMALRQAAEREASAVDMGVTQESMKRVRL